MADVRREGRAPEVRVALRSELGVVSDIVWRAFQGDPLWTWAFPDGEKPLAWWRLLITSALRYPWVFVAGQAAAASVWIPPGGRELTAAEEEQVKPLLEELVGARASDVMELLEAFDAAHPSEPPHYYLSLLATHPEHRGMGLGMALFAENLRQIDREGMPAYLESSNPDNDRRYERLGFERTGEFSTPDGSRRVATMWREPA